MRWTQYTGGNHKHPHEYIIFPIIFKNLDCLNKKCAKALYNAGTLYSVQYYNDNICM